MASMRDIRRRIKSVGNTQKITKAMKMVSASKYRKAQSNLSGISPYINNIVEIISDLLHSEIQYENPLMKEREDIERVLYIVVAGDRGLCGGFNINVLREAAELIDSRPQGRDYGVMTLGVKAEEYFRARGYNVIESYSDIGDYPSVSRASDFSYNVMKRFLDEEFDEVYMVYEKFNSVISQIPTVFQVLPVRRQEIYTKELESLNEFIFEPSEAAIIDVLLPMYVFSQIYRAVLESKTGEHGARMTSMDSATDNATELIDKLTLSLNRARQTAITTEITEIVGGAAALE